jgi:hypothetical protein
MHLEPDELRAEADAQTARAQTALWAEPDGQRVEHWTDVIRNQAQASGAAPPLVAAASGLAASSGTISTDRLHERRVDILDEAVPVRTPSMGQIPDWLQMAAGNPLTYDAPEGRRIKVCVRLLPATYARVKTVKTHLGLRTIAGTWEYLIRLGMAAAERVGLGNNE